MEKTTKDSDTSDDQQKTNQAPVWNPSDRASNDYRETGIVELDIGKVREILQRIEERSDDEGINEEIDSFHVVGHICSGWEKGIGAKIDEEAPHLDAEIGENFLFSHWDAIPCRISRRSEYVASRSPRTFKNRRISEELTEVQKTTDLDRLRDAGSKIRDAKELVEAVDNVELKRDFKSVLNKVEERQLERTH